MDQPGVEVRPITQLTRTSEFNEVFFDGARTNVDNVVGGVGDGWRVALATLAFERGVALLGHQLGFRRELDRIVALAEDNGRARDPVVRQRLAQAHIELTIMRYNTLRSLSGVDGPVAPPEASIAKLFWGSWHRRLGELAMDVLGPAATVLDGEPRPTTAGTGSVSSSAPFSSHGRRPFTVARTRSSATSSASGCSASRRSRKGRRDRRAWTRPSTRRHHRRHRAATGSSTARWSSSRRPPERGSVRPRPGAASRRGHRSSCPTRTSAAWPRRPSNWRPRRGPTVRAACTRWPATCATRRRCAALYDGAAAHFGRFDVAVHNAGLGGTVPLVEMTDEQWSTVLDITLTGTFRCTRAALTRMLPQGRGVIVNNASVLGWRAQPGQAHYAAAKAGVMALTRCAAAEAAPFGVRVNAVSPSLAEHPFLNRAIPDEDLAVLRRRELFGRGAETWEVANVIVFLASDYSSYMSGEVISVSSQHP